MEYILEARGVSYSYYGKIPALDDVSLGIKAGARFAIIGSNGSGKSTLLQMLNGLMHPSRGGVFFRGKEVTEGALRDRGFLRSFRSKNGFIFQDSDVQLFSPTVLDELIFAPLQLGLKEGEALERAADVMRMLNIEGLRDRPSYMLSGGEKKRVAIGSVLTMDPDVLLMDEPTNGLDPKTQCFLIELIYRLSEEGKTIVIATHDLSLVSELDSDIAVLSEGHRVERTGRTDEVLNDVDMLLRVNLIHEHMHSHGQTTHKHAHLHYIPHRH